MLIIEKHQPAKIFSAIYFDGEKEFYYLKRFEAEPTTDKAWLINESDNSKLIAISEDYVPQVQIEFGGKHLFRPKEIFNVEEFIGVKGYKAKGKRLSTFEVDKVSFIEPIQAEQPQLILENENENENNDTDVDEAKEEQNKLF